MNTRNPYIYSPSSDFRRIDSLTGEERQQEMEALRDALTYHNYLRSVLREPEVSEEVYQRLRLRLAELENRPQ